MGVVQKANSIFLALSLVGLSGCGGTFKSLSSSSIESQSFGRSNFDMNKYAVNKLVCNPFDDNAVGEVTTLDGGLQATLYYLRADQPRYSNVGDMIKNGVQSGKNLFFSNVSIPTRLFHLGFPLETGGMVKTDEGADLVEYFALRMTGSLGLAPDEEEGQYELALLSDDGVVWTNTSDNVENPILINNDGDHPTKMACGQVVNMTRESRIPSRIDYYQGPRYHISLVPMWRKVDANTPVGLDPLCNKLGNSLFFDPNNGSSQQQAYKDLLSRGWRALRAENWKLVDGSDYNPCSNQGEVPQVSDLAFDRGDGGVVVTWRTNIPATSQVLLRNTTTNVDQLTVSDNILRTRHSVVIRDVALNYFYEIQAISVSATLGRIVTPPVRLTDQ